MSKLKRFAAFIDRMNEVVGKAVSYLVVPLTLIVVYEVMMRYVFDAPTLWAWDVNMYLGGLMTILGAGYAPSVQIPCLGRVFCWKSGRPEIGPSGSDPLSLHPSTARHPFLVRT